MHLGVLQSKLASQRFLILLFTDSQINENVCYSRNNFLLFFKFCFISRRTEKNEYQVTSAINLISFLNTTRSFKSVSKKTRRSDGMFKTLCKTIARDSFVQPASQTSISDFTGASILQRMNLTAVSI